MTKVIPPGADQPVDLVPDRGGLLIRFEPLVRCSTEGCETLQEPGAGPCGFCRGQHNTMRKRRAKERKRD
jgi:hypothetical protein